MDYDSQQTWREMQALIGSQQPPRPWLYAFGDLLMVMRRKGGGSKKDDLWLGGKIAGMTWESEDKSRHNA